MIWKSSGHGRRQELVVLPQAHEVEQGPGCAGKDRMGPYPTREAAEQWRETVERRNKEWDAQDDDW